MIRLFGRKDSTLERVKALKKYLQYNLKNRDLQYEIVSKLDGVIDKYYGIISLDDDSIVIALPHGNTFSFTREESTLETFRHDVETNSITKTTIEYNGDLITVSINKSVGKIDDFTSLPSSILRSSEKRIYKNDLLVYRTKYESYSTSSLNDFHCMSEFDELVINSENNAVRRYISLDNDEYNVPDIKHFRNKEPYCVHFNTVDNGEAFDHPMVECDERYFNKFISVLDSNSKSTQKKVSN